MKHTFRRMWQEDDGVLSFEWVLTLTLLVIGIVSGVAAARDAIVDEIGDFAEAAVALDQSFVMAAPLAPFITDPDIGVDGPSGGSDSEFVDFAVAFDCQRGGVVGFFDGQPAEFDLD